MRITPGAANVLTGLLKTDRGEVPSDELRSLEQLQQLPLPVLFGDELDAKEAVLVRAALVAPSQKAVAGFKALAKGRASLPALSTALRMMQSMAVPAQRAERMRIADQILALSPDALFSPPTSLSTQDQRLFAATVLAHGYAGGNVFEPLPLADVEQAAIAFALQHGFGASPSEAAAVAAFGQRPPSVLLDALRGLPPQRAATVACDMRGLLDGVPSQVLAFWIAPHIEEAPEILRAIKRIRPSEPELFAMMSLSENPLISLRLFELARPTGDVGKWESAAIAYTSWTKDPVGDVAAFRLLLRSGDPGAVVEAAGGIEAKSATLTALLSLISPTLTPEQVVAICSIDWDASRASFDAYVAATGEPKQVHDWLLLRDQLKAPSSDKGVVAVKALRRIRWADYVTRESTLEKELNTVARRYAGMLTDPAVVPVMQQVAAAARPDLGIDLPLLLTNAMAEGLATLVDDPAVAPIAVDETVSGFDLLGTDTFGSRVDVLKARGLFPKGETRYQTVEQRNELGELVLAANFDNLFVGLLAVTALMADERRNAVRDAKALFGASLTREQADYFTFLYYNAGSAVGRAIMKRDGIEIKAFVGAQPSGNRNPRYNALSRLATLRMLRSVLP